jgi:hypothetical protein
MSNVRGQLDRRRRHNVFFSQSEHDSEGRIIDTEDEGDPALLKRSLDREQVFGDRNAAPIFKIRYSRERDVRCLGEIALRHVEPPPRGSAKFPNHSRPPAVDLSVAHSVTLTPIKASSGGAIVIARGSLLEKSPGIAAPVIWFTVEPVS